MLETIVLNKCEVMSHDERWAYLIEKGISDSERTNPVLLDTMRKFSVSENHYERLLSMMYAQGSKDEFIIRNLVTNKSTTAMRASIKLAAEYLTMEELMSIIPDFPKNKRRLLLSYLAKYNRENIIETLFNQLEFEDQNYIIGITSEAFLNNYFDLEMLKVYPEAYWKRLAHYKPHFAYNKLIEILRTTRDNKNLRLIVDGVLKEFLKYEDTRSLGLDIIKEAIIVIPQQYLRLKQYFSFYPNEIGNLVLEYPFINNITLNKKIINRMNEEVLSKLLSSKKINFPQLNFGTLNKETRDLFYKVDQDSWRNSEGVIPINNVKYLSYEDKVKEVERALSLDSIKAMPLMYLEYAKYLPFESVKYNTSHFMKYPEPEIRRDAYIAYIYSSQYDIKHNAEVLDLCLSKKHEQDPIKGAMIQTFMMMSQENRWSDKDLEKINLLIDAIFDSKDVSHMTLMNVLSWMYKLLPHYPDFALKIIPKTIEKTGTVYAHYDLKHLSIEDVIKIDKVMIPLFESWMKEEKHFYVISMSYLFSSNLKKAYEKNNGLGLVRFMIECASSKKPNHVGNGITALFKHELYDVINELIPNLLKKDSSYIKNYEIQTYISRKRQDLLTPFLTANVYRGVYGGSKSKEIIRFYGPYYRWTKKQQKIYADTNIAFVSQTNRNLWEQSQTITLLKDLPSASHKQLYKWADLSEESPFIRDRALIALSQLDGNEGLEIIKEAMKDDRFFTATYAFNSNMKYMNEDEILDFLVTLPFKGISQQKEIVRMIGSLKTEAAIGSLYKYYTTTEDLHQDIKIALLRTLMNYMNYEELWPLFYSAADSVNDSIANSIIWMPQTYASLKTQNTITKIMSLLLNNDNKRIQQATLSRLIFDPVLAPSNDLFKDISSLLKQHEDMRINAARALIKNYSIERPQDVANVFSKLEESKYLKTVVKAYTYDDIVYNRSAMEFTRLLIKENRLPSLGLSLSLNNLTIDDIKTTVIYISEEQLSHPGLIQDINDGLDGMFLNNSMEDIISLCDFLKSSDQEVWRVLSLRIIKLMAEKHGWTKDLINRVERYKSDDSAWVRETYLLLEKVEY